MKNKHIIINILGAGCPNCIKLENNTNEAIKNLNLEASVEKITNIKTIMSYGAMSTPALVVNNKIVCSGRVPGVEEIKTILIEQKQENIKSASNDCSCGEKH